MRTTLMKALTATTLLIVGGLATSPADAARAPVTTLTGKVRCTGEATWTVDWTYRVKAPKSVKTKRSVAAMHSDGTDRRVLKRTRSGSWSARWSTPGQNWAQVHTRFAGRVLDEDYLSVPPGDCGGPVTGVVPVPPGLLG